MSMPPGPYAVAVVLAAGLGTRVGADGNKAYLPLAGRSMVPFATDEEGNEIITFAFQPV